MPHATLVDESVSPDPGVDQRPDQRQAERLQLSHPALVTLVGTTRQLLHGMIRNVSEGGTQVRLDQPVSSSTLVKIEYDDNLLLGEVVYCQRDDSGWLAGIKIEHSLFELTALAADMRRF